MTKDSLVTAPEGTSLEEAESNFSEHRIEKLPLVDDDGNLKGLITIKILKKRQNIQIQLKMVVAAY